MYHRQVSSQPYPGVQYRPAPNPRAQSAAVASPRTGYTLGHAGRQLRVGPIVFLGGGRHAGDHGGLDHHHRNLFRIPRRRADRAHRTPSRNAIRLRGSHRRFAPAGRPHVEPPAPQPGAIRDTSSTRSCGGSRRWKTAPSAIQAMPDSIVTGSTRPTGREQTRSVPNRPSPVNDKSSNLLLPEPPTGARQRHLEHPRPPASVARSRRSAAGGVAVLDRSQLRGQGAAHPRCSGRSRPRRPHASPRATIQASAARWFPRGTRWRARRAPARSNTTSTA